MRIAICEDNHTEALQLMSMLKGKAELFGENTESITIFHNASELLNTNYEYELLFIDCNLPDLKGTDLAKQLRKKGLQAEIVFVTAYNDYAVEGYECGALRYLLKPLSEKKLTEAFAAFVKKQQINAKIDIKSTGMPTIVRSSEIMYIEAVENKTLVRLEGMDINSKIPLSDFEKLLHYPTFFRTSRQFIVNMQYVNELDKNSITMENGEHVKISRRNINEFKKKYKSYILNNFFTEDDEE